VRVSPRKYGVLAPPPLRDALALRLRTWRRRNDTAAAGASASLGASRSRPLGAAPATVCTRRAQPVVIAAPAPSTGYVVEARRLPLSCVRHGADMLRAGYVLVQA
jgi:hypothetical protein